MLDSSTIAFICPSTAWGGLEMNVFRLAKWLKKRGYRIILYGNPRSMLYQKTQTANITVRPLVSHSKLRDLFIAGKLARMLKKDNARIAVLHMNKNFILATLAKMFSGDFFKLTYMQHMHVGPAKRDFFHSWLYRRLDRWIAPLPLFKEAIQQKTTIPAERIAVIPHGLELEPFTCGKPDKVEARERLDLPVTATIAGVVGRLDPKKGQHILIEACHKLKSEGVELHMLFVGEKSFGEETGYAEKLNDMILEYGLTDQAHFRSYMDNVQYAFAAMDIFTLTSKSETYGMVTLEAMASALPVIGTAEGGTVGIIDDSVDGLLVEPYNPDVLHAALKKILSDSLLRDRLARAAREKVVRRFSHVRECEMLEDLFEDLLS